MKVRYNFNDQSFYEHKVQDDDKFVGELFKIQVQSLNENRNMVYQNSQGERIEKKYSDITSIELIMG